MPADGKAVDGGDPRLLDAAAMHIIGNGMRLRNAAQELVHVAEIPLHEPQKRNPAAIEMSEIDPGAEGAAVAIFGMLEHTTAHHRNVGCRIKNGEIDRKLSELERRLVLGVEKARIRHGHMDRPAPSLDRRGAEIDTAFGGKPRQRLHRLRARQQHGMAEMHAGALARQHMRQKNALVDLDAVLVALQLARFRCQLHARRRKPWNEGRGLHDQCVEPQEQ